MQLYQNFLNSTKSIFLDKQTWQLLGIFIGLRLLSFLLFDHDIIQAILMFAILMAFGVIYFKSVDAAWMVLLGELFLGGAGHFLEIFGLSLRSMLVFTFIVLWVLHHISLKHLHSKLKIKHNLSYYFIPLAVFVFIAAIRGFVFGNGFINIIRDLIPYSFLILLLPFYHYFQKPSTQEYLIRLLLVFILGSAIFALFTFIIYSGGIGVLQDTYYHWFRDIAMGKLTDMGTGFFRIVTPEHLLVVPGILLICSLLMRDESHHKLWRFFLFLGLIILVLDLSRTFLLALVVGLIALKYKHKWSRWLIISCTTLFLFFAIFVSFSIVASGGKTFGLELFGLRIGSLVQPSIETSTHTRMTLLEPILGIIKQHPLLGNGLGSSITFYSPVVVKNIKTTQFDWGYLELFAELGLFGFLSFMAIIALVIFELVMKIESLSDYHDFYVGIFGGVMALVAMTITSPALFHVLGILFLTIALAISMKPVTIFEKILPMIYRVFHKLQS